MTEMENTKAVCNEQGILYVNRENGNKYGDAIRTSIKYAKWISIIFIEADGSHSPKFTANLYQQKTGNDLVIAPQFIEGGGSDNTKIVVFISLTVNFIYSFLFNLKYKNVSNSFILYIRDLLLTLKLNYDNFHVTEKILKKLKRNNKNITLNEIPYIFKERMFGQTKRNLVVFVFSYTFVLIKLMISK